MKDLNIKLTLSDENRENLHDLGFGDALLDHSIKSTIRSRRKLINETSLKLKSFVLGEKKSAKHIYDKGLVFRSYTELLKKYLPKDMLINFFERGEGRERRNINQLPLIHALNRDLLYTPQPRDQIHNLGMCPEWEWNPRCFGLPDDAPTK